MRVPFFALLLLLGGCYTFRTSLPGHIQTVRIPVVQNETLEVELADELTTALTERFVRDNQLRVVQGDSDSVLEGRITGYEDRVFSFNAAQQADEYVVIVTVDLALRDRVRQKELWREESMRGVSSYFPGGSDANLPRSPEEARTKAIEQLVETVVSRTFEGW